MKDVIAISPGFHNGQRIRTGQPFQVEDKKTGKWFVDAADYVPPTAFGKLEAKTNSEASRRKAESFVEAMKKGGQAAAPDLKKAAAGEQAKGKKAAAGEQAKSDEGRASDQVLI